MGVPGHDWSYAPDHPHADEDTHATMPAHRDGWPTVVFIRAGKNGLIRTEIALIICTNEEIVDFVLYLNRASPLFERTRVVKTTHVSRARDAPLLRLVLNAVVNGG